MKILKGILASFIFITSVVSCSSSDDDTNDCTRSKEASTLAETAYNIDKQNEVLCKNYKTALENEITTCGDTDGILQTKIDALGNCTFVDHGTLSVTVGTLNIEFSLINIELASGLIKVKGSKQGQGSDHSI
ncbi:MAG TPA: hypothetical protein DDY16_04080, partial [Tenacibaculum sp.]|nr:hypothetical protein [Tenacibaculum sp.]